MSNEREMSHFVTPLTSLLPSSALLMARGRGTFGLTSRGRGRGYTQGFRGGSSWRGGRGRGRGRGGGHGGEGSAPKREDDGTQLAEKFERSALNDEIDEKLGFPRIQEGARREGWLVNLHPVSK
jgi:DNA polymerase epsilon subunit 1